MAAVRNTYLALGTVFITENKSKKGKVVSFTPRPLYPQGKNTRYLLDRRMGGPRCEILYEG
jgi:hypothetical protein